MSATIARMMQRRTGNFLLTFIAVSLAAIALRPLFAPPAVKGQDNPAASGQLVILPQEILYQDANPANFTTGFTMIDTQTGNIYAYPLRGPKAYTAPILLGTFAGPGKSLTPPGQ